MAARPIELADGGLETTLVFHEGLDLPCFAAFPLVGDEEGCAALRRYFQPFLELAHERGMPFVLDTATWRANPDWGERLGYDADALAAANAAAVEFARELAARSPDVTINGVVGPRGDGYVVDERMSAEEAREYHRGQVEALVGAGAERITGVTITYPDEAIGIVHAATGTPVVVSFTLETDGRLPDGTPLAEAIERVDDATGGAAEFFMVNCAHPTHIAAGLAAEPALERIGGLRVNASAMSHEELDAAEELDEGDPVALARDHADLRSKLPSIRLLGGCCGTDHRHVREILSAWSSP